MVLTGRCPRLARLARSLAVASAMAAPGAAAAGALGPSPDASLKVLGLPFEIGSPASADQPLGESAAKSKNAEAPRGLDLGEGVVLSPSFATSQNHDIQDPSKRRPREPWLKLTVPLSK